MSSTDLTTPSGNQRPTRPGLTTRVLNEAMLARLTSEDWGLCGEAEQAMNDYTRVRMREDGFLRRILPSVSITNDEFDRQVDTDTPVRVTDMDLRDVLTHNAIMASQVELRKRGYRTLREIRMAKHGA